MNEKNTEIPTNSIPIPDQQSVPPVPRKESNRLFNLIWLALYSMFVVPSVYVEIQIIKNHTTTDFPIFPILFIPVALIVCLFLVIPRRNNFFTLPLFIFVGLISNFIFAKFYDLTWLFCPEFLGLRTIDSTSAWWLSIGSWGMAFLIVAIILYVFLSSFLRLVFKKTQALLCFILALFFTSIAAYILFFAMPQSFTFPQAVLATQLDTSITIEFQNPKAPSNEPKQITSAQSATQFYVYASGLPKGNRYGVRILSPDQTATEETRKFYYCRTADCQYELGQANAIGQRLDPGTYTVQIIAQKGDAMTIVAEKEIEITELVIGQYDATAEYPCELWLTLGESSAKLLRIEADSQEMTNIAVWAQCDGAKTYDAQIEVGTITQEVQYYSSMIPPGDEPTRIVSLGGNVANGLVRLIVDDQVMGEAIIDRGF